MAQENNMTKLEYALIGLIVFIIGLSLFCAIYQAVNCEYGHTGEPYYHAPTYTMVGKVLIPVGGGYYGDFVCDKWK